MSSELSVLFGARVTGISAMVEPVTPLVQTSRVMALPVFRILKSITEPALPLVLVATIATW